MGIWIVGEYTNVDNGEILDLIGEEPGEEGMVRVTFIDGQDVMPRTVLEYQYQLTPCTAKDWEELAADAEDEGPKTFAHFQMIRARHAA
jgi:hypothetical protein